VGAGVVGQATGKGFARKDYKVDYADIDPAKIGELSRQGLCAMQPSAVEWHKYDVIMVTVSTPTKNNRVVLDHIEAAIVDIGAGLATTDKFVTVVVRSTVPPTTTEQRLCPLLERVSGKRWR
jgi:UDPglucose 6-dehydrogenase